MSDQIQFTVSHAPFRHCGKKVSVRHYEIMAAGIIAVLAGFYRYGLPALGVVTFSILTAMLWELGSNFLMHRPITIGDGNAALIGFIFAMLLPAVTPWWVVLTGTFLAVIIGKQIYGGLGGNPFNPAVVAYAILQIAWPIHFDFNAALVNYHFDFNPAYPLALYKSFGSAAIGSFSLLDLLLGRQIGGIGATFGLGLIIGGVYLILRGIIRWEVTVSFLIGIAGTAFAFNLYNPVLYAGPGFHILTGFALVGAFFLATEDSSSPVNTLPMLIYGLLGGMLTVLIRNIGAYVDGVIYAILIINLANPLIDKIRPGAKKRMTTYA